MCRQAYINTIKTHRTPNRNQHGSRSSSRRKSYGPAPGKTHCFDHFVYSWYSLVYVSIYIYMFLCRIYIYIYKKFVKRFWIASQALEKLAYYGLVPNMILYLTVEYGMGTTEAANILFLWSAATNFFPLICAFIADSYTGRFPLIGFGSSTSLLVHILQITKTTIS